MAGDPLDAIYALAVRAAASREGVIDAATVRQIEADLQAFAAMLVAGIEKLPMSRQLALRRAAAIVQDAAEALDRALIQRITTSRQLVFRDTFQILAGAERAAARSLDIPLADLGAIPIPRLGDAHAFTAVAELYDFRTLVRGHVVAGAKDALAVIRTGIVRGSKPDAIARAIRPYILGAADIPGDVADLRKVPAAYRGAAKELAYNAKRIAYSETHAARMLSQAVRMRDDPFVLGGKWHTAPNRGAKTRIPDVCDVLRDADFFGIGPGVYPSGRIPAPPHPWDRSIASWTPVLTLDGWKPVSEVTRGTLVLTHRGRWRPVTESIHGRRTGRWLEVHAGGQKLTITDDHPVLLADGRWILAGALSVGDRMVRVADLGDGVTNPLRSGRAIGAPRALLVEDEQRPAARAERRRFRRILSALLRRVVPSSVDLDSEHDARNRDVDVPPADGVESFSGDAPTPHAREDRALVLGQPLMVVHGEGCLLTGRNGEWLPAELRRCTCSTDAALVGAHALADESVRLSATAARNTESEQGALYASARDAEALCSLEFGEALSNVQPLQFCAVEVLQITVLACCIRRYCLTVAQDSSFVAAGLVVHNCNVTVVPRALKPGEDWRAPKPAPDSYTMLLDPAHDPLPHVDEMTPAAEARVRRDLAQLLGR